MNKKYTPSVNLRTARPRSKRRQAVGRSYTVIKNTGISGSSESAKIDTSMSDTSGNAVANKVIKRYVDAVRSYFEGKVPKQVLIDIANILTATIINREIRDELYNIFTYTEGDDITTDPAWVIDTNGQHYIIKMLETETGVGFYIIGYEGFTRIEGDNTKTNQLLWDKADKKYADETFFSQAHFDQAKTHDYVKSYYNYRNESPKTLELGIDLVIQDDIEAADEENDDDLQNGIFHNGLVTAMGVKTYVDSKAGLTVDSELSDTSTKPVQNKVITEVLTDHDTRISDMESFFAEGAKLTLRILSNQSDDEVIAAVKATIAYDDEVIEAGAGTIGLPPFKAITVTFPDVEGYKTPEPLEFETGAVPVSYSVTYETEVARVILSAYDDVSVIGSTVIINGTSYVWNGIIIEHKIPYGVTYKAEATTDIEEHIRPEETFTASQPTREIGLQYSAMVGSWIVIDQTITDPATMISGDVNGEHIQLIRNNSHRYLGKYTAEGTMTICQLDDSDSGYYADGSAADLTGAEGDVFMRLPRFFYIASEKRTDVWKIGFYYGDAAPSGKWQEWDGNDLIGAYLGFLDPDMRLRSVANSSVHDNPTTLTETVGCATVRGAGYMMLQWRQRRVLSVLFYAKYGRTDWRNVIGYDSGNYSGTSSFLGMQDTTPETIGEGWTNFWGIEGFGWIERVYRVVSCPNDIVEVTDGADERSYTLDFGFNHGTYITKCIIGKSLDFIPRDDAEDGTETTGYCDFHNIRSYSDRSVCCCRGIIGISQSPYNEDESGQYGNARITFRGTLIINNNPEAFKSLTAIN